MNDNHELLKVSGSLEVPIGGSTIVHGIATAMKDGVTRGVLFNGDGWVSTFEAIALPGSEDRGLVLISSAQGSADLKDFYVVRTPVPSRRIAEGTYGCYQLMPDPRPEELGSGAYHLDALAKVSRQALVAKLPKGDPILRMELVQVDWKDAYGELTPEKRAVADVVVWFSLYDEILGPDHPRDSRLNFFSAVCVRRVWARRGSWQAMPWSIEDPVAV